MEKSFDHTTYEFTNADGKIIWCQRWTPRHHPRGVVFLAHGFSEHSLYYVPMAEALISHGMVVSIHDHVGHGRSEGERAQVSNVDVYVRDVFQHLDLLHEKYPSTRFFMVGHSMGGAISYLCATQRPDFFRGIVLIGPALAPDPTIVTPFKAKMVNVLGTIWPGCPVSPMRNDIVTRNLDAIKQFTQDPLRYQSYVKAGWVLVMMKTMKRIQKTFNQTRWPFLILHGEVDKICALHGSKQLYQEALSSDKSLKVFPHAYHSLHLELEEVSQELLNDVVNWIDERAPEQLDGGLVAPRL